MSSILKRVVVMFDFYLHLCTCTGCSILNCLHPEIITAEQTFLENKTLFFEGDCSCDRQRWTLKNKFISNRSNFLVRISMIIRQFFEIL